MDKIIIATLGNTLSTEKLAQMQAENPGAEIEVRDIFAGMPVGEEPNHGPLHLAGWAYLGDDGVSPCVWALGETEEEAGTDLAEQDYEGEISGFPVPVTREAFDWIAEGGVTFDSAGRAPSDARTSDVLHVVGGKLVLIDALSTVRALANVSGRNMVLAHVTDALGSGAVPEIEIDAGENGVIALGADLFDSGFTMDNDHAIAEAWWKAYDAGQREALATFIEEGLAVEA